jgi:hypothetical protein
VLIIGKKEQKKRDWFMSYRAKVQHSTSCKAKTQNPTAQKQNHKHTNSTLPPPPPPTTANKPTKATAYTHSPVHLLSQHHTQRVELALWCAVEQALCAGSPIQLGWQLGLHVRRKGCNRVIHAALAGAAT